MRRYVYSFDCIKLNSLRSQSSSWSDFIKVALCNRAGHNNIIFLPCDFLSSSSFSSFFSSPNLGGRRLDVYHTSTHGEALVRI